MENNLKESIESQLKGIMECFRSEFNLDKNENDIIKMLNTAVPWKRQLKGFIKETQCLKREEIEYLHLSKCFTSAFRMLMATDFTSVLNSSKSVVIEKDYGKLHFNMHKGLDYPIIEVLLHDKERPALLSPDSQLLVEISDNYTFLVFRFVDEVVKSGISDDELKEFADEILARNADKKANLLNQRDYSVNWDNLTWCDVMSLLDVSAKSFYKEHGAGFSKKELKKIENHFGLKVAIEMAERNFTFQGKKLVFEDIDIFLYSHPLFPTMYFSPIYNDIFLCQIVDAKAAELFTRDIIVSLPNNILIIEFIKERYAKEEEKTFITLEDLA